MEKPKVPAHPICDKTMHADTLNRCEHILDLLSDLGKSNGVDRPLLALSLLSLQMSRLHEVYVYALNSE